MQDKLQRAINNLGLYAASWAGPAQGWCSSGLGQQRRAGPFMPQRRCLVLTRVALWWQAVAHRWWQVLHSITVAKGSWDRSHRGSDGTGGIHGGQLLLETRAQNTGENAVFSELLVRDRSADSIGSIPIITKSYMERRVSRAFEKQWPVNGRKSTVVLWHVRSVKASPII